MGNTLPKELTISRRIKAPRELVFRMWTEPEHIKNWWGPEGFTSTIYEMDVRPGGNWEFTMHGPDGTDYRNHSKYVEIEEPSRIVLDHISAPKFRMTVTFVAEGDSTLVSITSVFESNEQLQQVIKVFRADEGMRQNVERLSNYLQSDLRSAGDFVIERLFNTPVSRVWRAITDRDEMAQWYFRLADFRPEVGFEFRFAGGPEDRSYLHICEVTEVVPDRRLTYSWRYDGYEGRSFVTFELTPDGDKTRLRLTHSGLHTFPADNGDFARSNFQMGWTAIIGDSLKKYLEP